MTKEITKRTLKGNWFFIDPEKVSDIDNRTKILLNQKNEEDDLVYGFLHKTITSNTEEDTCWASHALERLWFRKMNAQEYFSLKKRDTELSRELYQQYISN